MENLYKNNIIQYLKFDKDWGNRESDKSIIGFISKKNEYFNKKYLANPFILYNVGNIGWDISSKFKKIFPNENNDFYNLYLNLDIGEELSKSEILFYIKSNLSNVMMGSELDIQTYVLLKLYFKDNLSINTIQSLCTEIGEYNKYILFFSGCLNEYFLILNLSYEQKESIFPFNEVKQYIDNYLKDYLFLLFNDIFNYNAKYIVNKVFYIFLKNNFSEDYYLLFWTRYIYLYLNNKNEFKNLYSDISNITIKNFRIESEQFEIFFNSAFFNFLFIFDLFHQVEIVRKVNLFSINESGYLGCLLPFSVFYNYCLSNYTNINIFLLLLNLIKEDIVVNSEIDFFIKEYLLGRIRLNSELNDNKNDVYLKFVKLNYYNNISKNDLYIKNYFSNSCFISVFLMMKLIDYEIKKFESCKQVYENLVNNKQTKKYINNVQKLKDKNFIIIPYLLKCNNQKSNFLCLIKNIKKYGLINKFEYIYNKSLVKNKYLKYIPIDLEIKKTFINSCIIVNNFILENDPNLNISLDSLDLTEITI